MALNAIADISSKKDRIEIDFPYSEAGVENVKQIPGARWSPTNRKWSIPANLTTARRLREAYGEWLQLSPRLRAWGIEQVKIERSALETKHDPNVNLEVLPHALPELHRWLRPYQLQDIAFMAAHNCINANQPGLGKTIETIAAIVEAGRCSGTHLISAPATSLRLVWEAEIKRWLPEAEIYVWSGDLTKSERKQIKEAATCSSSSQHGLWVVTTPNMVRTGSYPLADTKRIWDSFIIDEFHKAGLSNGQSQLNKVARKIKARKRFALSGTPMGGQPIKLWGALNFLDPKTFSSKWQWAEQFLEVESNGFGKVINGVKVGRESEFKKHLSTRMVRRTKSEVVKQLPPKQYIHIYNEMSKAQGKQYEAFKAELQVMIDEQKVSAVGVLAEMTRLKQFANARCTVGGRGEIIPTTDSGKLAHLLDRLEERGICAGGEGDEVAIVASESKRMIEMVSAWLNEQKIPTSMITGDTSHDERQLIVQKFQGKAEDAPRVICLTTTAGGVAITLDRADTVHILDETWNPDDQEQLEDRVHRISRIHQVTIYYYRTEGTIQESIARVNEKKRVTNSNILSLSKKILA